MCPQCDMCVDRKFESCTLQLYRQRHFFFHSCVPPYASHRHRACGTLVPDVSVFVRAAQLACASHHKLLASVARPKIKPYDSCSEENFSSASKTPS